MGDKTCETCALNDTCNIIHGVRHERAAGLRDCPEYKSLTDRLRLERDEARARIRELEDGRAKLLGQSNKEARRAALEIRVLKARISELLREKDVKVKADAFDCLEAETPDDEKNNVP